MTKRMLIDASHAEETRVVVLDGNRLEDFDVETATKRQLKGNIYLAKVVRVEPSLQAAFVEYGGNRHGFLAFDEIHPDYYQIPIADRQRLLEMQAQQAREEEEEADRDAERRSEEAPGEHVRSTEASDEAPAPKSEESRDGTEIPDEPAGPSAPAEAAAQPLEIDAEWISAPVEPDIPPPSREGEEQPEGPPELPIWEAVDESGATPSLLAEVDGGTAGDSDARYEPAGSGDLHADEGESDDHVPETPPPETVGGETDPAEDAGERRIPYRFLRSYKIQEVIRRRQILLVQVVKEERGTKGAALTTYISLAGRYCVLMPNSPRGGGISRKITSPADRRRLKEVMTELDLPAGMGLIVRTAGANRPKPEIKRDCEYLLRLWDEIRELTLRSVAPALIYEEASLIKRAIRDVYSRDVDEVVVDGEDGWRAARDFMRMLMPTHVKKVQLWRDGGQPLFARHQVDAQLDAILSPTVQLRSGGYLVINQAEALVAIDVNSGRSTRERGIEETALRTNLEAADEVARQLRLRDLAGLIVIDFIDMESKKHNNMVERRLKEALKTDRARIQVGHISHFGLLEMSRQRLRPSLAETSFITCPHCAGTGHVRSTESAAIHVLRGIEEEGGKHRAAEILVHTASATTMYIFNHKRDRLAEIETRSGMRVTFAVDETIMSSQYRIERIRTQVASESPAAITAGTGHLPEAADVEEEEESAAEADRPQPPAEPESEAAVETTPVATVPESAESTAAAEDAEPHRRRRRRRRRGRRDEAGDEIRPSADDGAEAPEEEMHVEGVPETAEPVIAAPRSGQRRYRRGNQRRPRAGELPDIAAPGADQPSLPPVYFGPTPADPFGGQAFDIFDVLERAEFPEPALPTVEEPPAIEPVPDRGPEPDSGPEPASFSPPDAEDLPTPAVEETAETVPTPANDREPEPAIVPIVVGADEPLPADKKHGWWRRR
jgi:ribonuclease E